MSFTGFKSLYFFSLLLEAPKSYNEVCEAFKKHEFIKESISIDTFRVYLTSLKRAGCQIVRIRKADGSKYKLVSHPFELSIDDEQIKVIAKVYKTISKNIDIDELIILDNFLQKLVNLINNKKLRETYEKISVFRDADIELVKTLSKHCANNDEVTFLYNSPRSGQKQIRILTDKISFSNNKLYLYGTSLEYKQYAYFPVSRIETVLNVALHKTDISDIKVYTVGYELKGNDAEIRLGKDEKIIEVKDNNTVLVEFTSSNLFMIKQKILSYGSSCKVLYPDFVRQEIISTLKQMRAGYLDGKN